MNNKSSILVVEHDILVRQPLAEYLRECGYTVIEAGHTDEAITVLSAAINSIDIVLADVTTPEKVDGFVLAHWVKSKGIDTNVILAGTVQKAAATAEKLCEHGPMLAKPYDHRLLHDRIKQELAARSRLPK